MKTLLWAFLTWFAPLCISLFALIVGALTAGKGVSAGENAVISLGLLYLAVFIGGSIFLWQKLGVAHGSRVLVVGPHLFVQLGTVAILVFSTVVAFNR